jgi:hypothetical protein
MSRVSTSSPTFSRTFSGRGGHVAHQEHALDRDAHGPKHRDLLPGDVRLGAVRADPYLVDAVVQRGLEVALDAGETGDRQHAEPGGTQLGLGGAQHLGVAERGHADLDGRGAEPVAVADLDDVHAGGLGRPGVGADVLAAELVRDRVVAVPQGRIADAESRRAAHDRLRSARASPTASAAQVMMSRLPA